MIDAAFDTLETMRDLEAAGVERAHAEAIAGAVRKAAADRDALADKADITRLETTAKADIARLEATAKADIARLEAAIARIEDKLETKADKADLAALEARMYRALWMQAGAIVAAVVALVKLLP